MEKCGKLIRAGAAALVACGISLQAAAQESGAYLGASFGQTRINGFCSDVSDVVFFLGGSPAGCDQTDTGFKIFGGYRVNRNFAIEGSYFDYGEASLRANFPGGPLRLSGEATAFGVAAVGILPVNPQLSLFGKAGMLLSEAKVRAIGPAGAASESEDETGLHYGIGLMFNFAGNMGLRLEWERNDEVDIDMLSIGLQVRF